MIRKWAMTGLGLGFAPAASGTLGSAGAVALALGIWRVQQAIGAPRFALDAAWIALAFLAALGCVAWGAWAVDYFAARSRKPGDPGPVVIDELAGQWVALIGLPLGDLRQTLSVLAVQFFLFRLFDVIKPPPARQLEKLPAGWGILLDDVAAGIYANILGQVVFRWFCSWH